MSSVFLGQRHKTDGEMEQRLLLHSVNIKPVIYYNQPCPLLLCYFVFNNMQIHVV